MPSLGTNTQVQVLASIFGLGSVPKRVEIQISVRPNSQTASRKSIYKLNPAANTGRLSAANTAAASVVGASTVATRNRLSHQSSQNQQQQHLADTSPTLTASSNTRNLALISLPAH